MQLPKTTVGVRSINSYSATFHQSTLGVDLTNSNSATFPNYSWSSKYQLLLCNFPKLLSKFASPTPTVPVQTTVGVRKFNSNCTKSNCICKTDCRSSKYQVQLYLYNYYRSLQVQLLLLLDRTVDVEVNPYLNSTTFDRT